MTQVFPISSVATPSTTPSKTASSSTSASSSTTTPATGSNALNESTFLQLLVAQLKYQDPMSPTDSTQFLTQTAQFTELETLQKIETEQASLATSSQTLAAATMVGRSVTYSLAVNGNATTPTPTSVVSVRGTLPQDAPNGTQASADTTIYTKDGQKADLTLLFTKSDSGWSVQAQNNGHSIGSAMAIGFDASGDHTNNDLTIPADQLEGIEGTSGEWPPAGITLGFGGTNDPTRLQLGSGPASVAVAEQNGNDGNSATGIVTGIHMTTDGPQLVIGGQNIPLTSVSDVQS